MPKFALISDTIRDRAKRVKILDHMHCQWLQHNNFEYFENVKIMYGALKKWV